MTTSLDTEVMFQIDCIYSAPREGEQCVIEHAAHLVKAPKGRGDLAKGKSEAWMQANDPRPDASLIRYQYYLNGSPGIPLQEDRFEPLRAA